MRKPIEELIMIHLVSDSYCCACGCKNDKKSFHKYMCDAHSHGMDNFNQKELQIVLNIEPEIISYIINTVAENILNNDIKPKDGLIISGVCDCDIRLDLASDYT